MSDVVIGDILPYTQIIATAGQTVFGTNWTADAASDVVVYYTPVGTPPNDATQILAYPSTYSVAFIGALQQVQVTLVTPAVNNGDIVTITRQTPADRLNLYTNTNFTPTMLNQDFGILTLVDQQAQLVNQLIGPRYNYSAVIAPNLSFPKANIILPLLGANQTWVMNPNVTEIITYTLPSGGVAPTDATYITLTDETSTLPNSFPLSTLATGFVVNQLVGHTLLTTTIAGTSNQISVVNGNGVGTVGISIPNNPIMPGTAGMGIPSGTTAQRVVPITNVSFRYNSDLDSLEFYSSGTWSQISDNTDGIVLPGLANQLGYYASNGSTISGLPTANNGILVTSGGGVPSISSTLPSAVQLNINHLGVIISQNLQVSGGGIISGSFAGGTAGIFEAFSPGAALGNLALTAANNVGNFSIEITNASFSQSTVLTIPDPGAATANLFASQASFPTSTTINQLLYSSANNVIAGLATTSSGVLTTVSGVPTWAAILSGALGGTGVSNSGKTITLGGNLTTSGAFASTFTMTGATNVTFPTSGTLATTSGASGVINPGLTNQIAYYAADGTTLSGTSTLPITVQTNITELGTITVGVWNAGAVTSSGAVIAGAALESGNTLGGFSGKVQLFPVTAAKGFLQWAATDNAGNFEVGFTNASFAQTTIITVPDPGVSATNFILADYPGNQIINSGSLSILSGRIEIGSPSGVGSAVNGSIQLFPTSSGKGFTQWQANANAGDFEILFQNSSFGQTTVITYPDPGAATANLFVSQASFPTSTTINQLLYSSANNVIAGLATTSSGVLTTVSSVPTWAATLSGALGGTGVSNSGKTITLGGNLTTSGAFNTTFTFTGATNVTFPTSGTLSTSTGTVTSITAGTNLTGGTITSTGTIGLSLTPSGLTSVGVGDILISGMEVLGGASGLALISSTSGNTDILLGCSGNGSIVVYSPANTHAIPLIFYNAAGTAFAGFSSPTTPSNNIWKLPTSDAAGVWLSDGSENLSITSLRDGEILIGTTGSIPTNHTLTAGTGISIANAPGSITISSSGTGSYPANYISGCGITFSTVEKLIIATGTAVDSTNTTVITSAGYTLDFTASGANGLDTSVVASNRIYYVFLIRKNDGTTASLASLSFSSPTLPSGYTTFRRIGTWQTVLGADLPIFIQRGNYNRREYFYADLRAAAGSDGFTFLTGGNATTATNIDISAYIPPSVISVNLQASIVPGVAADFISIRNADSSVYEEFIIGLVSGLSFYDTRKISLSALQKFTYQTSNALDSVQIDLISYEEEV